MASGPGDCRTEISGDIGLAAALLAEGQPVALPTETVYGLAADATRPDAILRIFEAKDRPLFDPLIVHLPDLGWLDRLVAGVPPVAMRLAEKFWPGPLTIVLNKKAIIPDIATSGLPTAAVRMSAHPVFRSVIGQFGRPVAAPSANRFGRISPTTAAHVLEELGGRIRLIIDGGPCERGIESTIVHVGGGRITVLRHGPISPEELAAFGDVVEPCQPSAIAASAPGQLPSHYAPATPLRLIAGAPPQPVAGKRVGLLAWSRIAPGFAACEVLGPNGDLNEAAAHLFAALRKLDGANLDLILAEPVPETGIGRAINERLRKAAHG